MRRIGLETERYIFRMILFGFRGSRLGPPEYSRVDLANFRIAELNSNQIMIW
jgi:hypothetical protein